ncbi:MAG: PepSY domain-containing protein [Geminicoccaceae bacterium]
MATNATFDAVAGTDRLTGRFYTTVWRWHFYAGLYVAPFLVMLAVTGLIMLWVSVLHGREGEAAIRVVPQAQSVPLAAQAEAARAAVPDGTIGQYLSPRGPDGAAVFRVDHGEDAQMVAVDPYTGTVVAQWPRRDGWYDFAEKIHGTVLIGDVGDRLIEIAAGFGVILLVTGLYLWWPRNGESAAGLLLPDVRGRGRALWKSLHRTTGFWISLVLLVFLLSGLSWTGVWGDRFVQAWSTFPAAKWDNVPLSDATHASMNHDGSHEVPWALEQTPMPASGSQAGLVGTPPGAPVNFDSVAGLARGLGFDGRFQVAFPDGESGVWTISQDSMSDDGPDPTSDRTVHLDRYTGKVLADVRYADYSLGGKAMAVGIAFHEGEMGWWNVAFNTLFCLSVIFLAVSGVVMWWKRRPSGASRLVAPPRPGNASLWKGAVVIGLFLCFLFPLTGAVLLAVLLLDLLVLRYVPTLRRALS